MTDRRQRQKERRAAKREAERKKEARSELFRRLGTAFFFGLIVVAIFVVGGLFGGDEPGDLPSSYETYRDQPTACGAEQPPAEQVMSFEAPETQTDITASAAVTAMVSTSCGDFTIELNTSGALATVNSFVFLARESFYDGQALHRIAPNFVFQGGDPMADGTGGPGYIIPDEYPDEGFVYEEGVVAMANRGARSTGSQFFVVTGPNGEFLTNSFSVLGHVVDGQDTLDAIMAIPTTQTPGSSEESLPLESVYITGVVIEVAGS